ncbi:MAG: hypothetical protein E7633_07490 [Ruminococcaceae bacterium]|nr:hypothetical protein [Oscillospiraceae bacterium]
MKKTIKSTISIILALCMLLASLAACEKEALSEKKDESVKEELSEKELKELYQNAPISWKLTVYDGAQRVTTNKTWLEIPEWYYSYFVTPVREIDKIDRHMYITVYFGYEYSFEDLPTEIQHKHIELYEKYGNFNIIDRDGMSKSEYSYKYSEIIDLKGDIWEIGRNIAQEKYKFLDFESSVEPHAISCDLKWDEETGFISLSGCFNFIFYNIYSSTLRPNTRDFSNWEWKDKLNELLEIDGIRKIRIHIEDRAYSCG